MNLTDENLEVIIFSTLRRCPHSLEDSVVAERIATAIIVSEEAVEKAIRTGCQNGVCGHASDCAVHNMPAYPAGSCDCGFIKEAKV